MDSNQEDVIEKTLWNRVINKLKNGEYIEGFHILSPFIFSYDYHEIDKEVVNLNEQIIDRILETNINAEILKPLQSTILFKSHKNDSHWIKKFKAISPNLEFNVVQISNRNKLDLMKKVKADKRDLNINFQKVVEARREKLKGRELE